MFRAHKSVFRDCNILKRNFVIHTFVCVCVWNKLLKISMPKFIVKYSK
jgi:hypothetical protein